MVFGFRADYAKVKLWLKYSQGILVNSASSVNSYVCMGMFLLTGQILTNLKSSFLPIKKH